jgi:hypothetical protein
MSDLLKSYLHYVVAGLAAFTIVAIFLLGVSFYKHELALSEAKAKTATLEQKQADTLSVVKTLQDGMARHDMAIDAIVRGKTLTQDEVRKYFQTYEETGQ